MPLGAVVEGATVGDVVEGVGEGVVEGDVVEDLGEDRVWLGAVVLDGGCVEVRVACVGVLVTGGSSRCPAVSGSEARPMRWRTSWLVRQVIAAATAIPSTATNATSMPLRRGLTGHPAETRAPRPRHRRDGS